jgi:hypothetical protein
MFRVNYALRTGAWVALGVLGGVLALVVPLGCAQAPAKVNGPFVPNEVAATISRWGTGAPFAGAVLDHPGVKLSEQGPWTVTSADLVQMRSLIVDLAGRNRDPLFVFLWNSLSSETRSALQEESAMMRERGGFYRPGEGLEELISDLNKLIEGKLIYDETLFARLKPYLSGDTVKLFNEPAGGDVSRLNRLLLEDAFPLDITRRPKILFDAATQSYVFIDFAKKTVSLYDKGGKRKWTTAVGPLVAAELEEFPYFRNPGIPASKYNIGLWDVSAQPGMILLQLMGNHFYGIDVDSGNTMALPHT